jgi:hypothetical protein
MTRRWQKLRRGFDASNFVQTTNVAYQFKPGIGLDTKADIAPILSQRFLITFIRVEMG